MLYSTGLWSKLFLSLPRAQCQKTFYVRNLRTFVLSQSVCQTLVEKFFRDKHPILLQKCVNYGQKCFKTLAPGLNVIRLYGRNLRTSLISKSICFWQALPVQSNVCEQAGACLSEVPLRCSTLGQFPGLIRKQQTRLERLVRDKHSSLLRTYVKYVRKKFHNFGPRQGFEPRIFCFFH